jgi:hypothetical protein
MRLRRNKPTVPTVPPPSSPEESLDKMTVATELFDEQHRIALYAVVCPEHGGHIVESAPAAIELAEQLNTAPTYDTGCVYYPVTLGLAPTTVQRIFAEPPENA